MIIAIGVACAISLLWIIEIDRERKREADRLEQARRQEFIRQRIEQHDIDVYAAMLRSAKMQDEYDEWCRTGRRSQLS